MQGLVNSLENKIDDTEKKYEETKRISEERLKQALEAESKIMKMKTDMQRLFYSCLLWLLSMLKMDNAMLNQSIGFQFSSFYSFGFLLSSHVKMFFSSYLKACREDL